MLPELSPVCIGPMKVAHAAQTYTNTNEQRQR